MEITKQYIEEPMFCPRCLSPLILGKDLRVYETIVEHVTNPNGFPIPKEFYICSNNSCLTRKYGIFWDFYGDNYSDNLLMDETLFVLDCSKAINSNSRKYKLEIRKRNTILLNIFLIRIDLEGYPIVDKLGIKIKGYRYKIVILIKKGNVYTYYIPGIKKFFSCINDFNKKYKVLLNNPKQKNIIDILGYLEYRSWDKRWWRLLSIWILNKQHPGLKDLLKNSLEKES